MGVLVLATGAIALTCVLLLTVVVGARVSLAVRTARRRDDVAMARGFVLELVAAEDERDALEAKQALVSLTVSAWRNAESSVIAFLPKVSGRPHAHLVDVLAVRGILERETGRLGARRATRRASAASFLGAARWADASSAVTALLSDPDRDVRIVAARVLGRIGDTESAVALLETLRRDDELPWSVATGSLVQLKALSREAVGRALTDPSAQVRSAAAHVVGVNGLSSAEPQLAAIVDSDDEDVVRAIAARSLGAVGSARSSLALAAASARTQPRIVRQAAVEGLGTLGTVEAIETLTLLCHEADLLIAGAAAAQLLRTGSGGQAALRHLRDQEHCPEVVTAVTVRAELTSHRAPVLTSSAGRGGGPS